MMLLTSGIPAAFRLLSTSRQHSDVRSVVCAHVYIAGALTDHVDMKTHCSASSPHAPKLGLYPPIITVLVPTLRMPALHSLRQHPGVIRSRSAAAAHNAGTLCHPLPRLITESV